MKQDIYKITILDDNQNISFSLEDYGKIEVLYNDVFVEEDNDFGFMIYNKDGNLSAYIPIGAFKKIIIFYEKESLYSKSLNSTPSTERTGATKMSDKKVSNPDRETGMYNS